MKNYKTTCTPYAKYAIAKMAEMLAEERKKHPEKDDDEWKQWCMDRIEWVKIEEK